MLHDDLQINSEGRMTIAGVDTAELAREYGTPLYVLDEDVIRERCRTYVTELKKHFGEDSKPLFASKALCFKGIYPIVESEGLCVDAVSPGEIYTA